MNENILISVVVPIYKVEKYLKRCIESLLKQTYTPIEIILVDDGSPDNCGEIIDTYAKEYSHIQAYHKKNGGLSSARNYGMQYAKGKYICFVDSDDWVDENYVKDFASHIKDESSIIIQDVNRVVNDNITYKTLKYEDSVYDVKTSFFKIKEKYKHFPCGYAWNKLYPMKIIKEQNLSFDETVSYSEDEEWNFRFITLVDNIVLVSNSNYNYVSVENSISNSPKSVAQEIKRVLFRIKFLDVAFKDYKYSNKELKVFMNDLEQILRNLSINRIYKLDLNKEQRIKELKNIYYTLGDGFKYINSDQKSIQLGYFLLKNKLFGLYDIYRQLRK